MIISLFYPILGGSEQQALRLAAGLVERGIPVSVLTRRMKGLPTFEKLMGIPIYRCIRTIQWDKLFGIIYILSVFWFLYKKRYSYDIVHCHIAQGFHSLVALLFKKCFKKRVIIKIAATGSISDFNMIRKIIFGGVFLNKMKNVDKIITVCSQSKREALAEGFSISSVIQIPNGVDISYFKPRITARRNKNRITFIGRLDSMKGVDILIKAFSELQEGGVKAHLDIIGDGPDRKKLENMVKELGLNDYVNFYGEVKVVLSLLQESSVFVLPSLSEGLSNVILEAMACALPIVATRVGGTTDLIRSGINGILVEPRNANQLSNAMNKVLMDRDLAEKLGAEARRTVERNYSMEHIIDKYLELYNQLLS